MEIRREPSPWSKLIVLVLIFGGLATVCWIALLILAAEKAIHVLFG